MNVRKAVITAAGRNQNRLPLQALVDRDGIQKPALRIIIEEAASAGVEEICVVVCPGDEQAYQVAAGDWGERLHFVAQEHALGYGHALHCARSFTGSDPFLHLVSDHLYLSQTEKRCAEQLVEIAAAEECSVSAVQATREAMLPYYGAVGGKGLANRAQTYQVEEVLEKPTPTEAEQQLMVPGLRGGYYLCFFGMHVLTPLVMEVLDEILHERGEQGGVSLSAALSRLAKRERYLAYELQGRRYNLGVKFGVLNAQLAFGLSGDDRDEVLSQLVETLALRIH